MPRLEFLKWKIKRLRRRADSLQNQAEDLNAFMEKDKVKYGGLAARYNQVCEHLKRILRRIDNILNEIERWNNV